MWQLDFYETDSGRCPVLDFISALNQKVEAPYIEKSLEMLKNDGNRLDYPHVKYLEDGIYELRIQTSGGRFRFLYFFYMKTSIIVTNGFRKKNREVKRHYIDLAKSYRKIYIERKSNES